MLTHHLFVNTYVRTVSCGLLLCLVMSAIIDNAELVSTSCGRQTYNFMGTISSANNIAPIGTIWQALIVGTLGLRLLTGYCAYMYLHQSGQPRIGGLMAMVLHAVECISLVFIAIIPSKTHLGAHSVAFSFFAVSAFMHQGSRLVHFNECSKFSEELGVAYRKLRRIFLIGSVLLVVTLTTAAAHFAFCTSGAYSIFAMFEYMYVIYGNIYFHSQAFTSIGHLNSFMLTIKTANQVRAKTSRSFKSPGLSSAALQAV